MANMDESTPRLEMRGERGVGMSMVSTDESTWTRDEQTKGAVST